MNQTQNQKDAILNAATSTKKLLALCLVRKKRLIGYCIQ